MVYMADKVILIIDDEKQVCGVIKEGLERRGLFKVITAYNGKDGIHKARKVKPDLILLDVNMPSMSGFKALELLKEDLKTYHIPVVMLTGQNDEDFRITAASLYCEDYITKPISMVDLKARINAILTRFDA
jgi:two-component system alkaline phosphatase synthesis response regulator PhoP